MHILSTALHWGDDVVKHFVAHFCIYYEEILLMYFCVVSSCAYVHV